MNCLIPILSACLLDPSTVEVRADTSYQVSGSFQYRPMGRVMETATIGMFEVSAGGYLGRGLTVRYGVRHTSILEVYDRGEERAFVGLVWRPFK